MAHGTLFAISYGPSIGRPDALHPPAWVVLLTAVAVLGGHSLLLQQLVACGIGTAAVIVIGLAGRRLAGDRAGLVAAGLAGGYAGLWIYERALLSETLVVLEIGVLILIAYRFREHPSRKGAVALGAMCGLLALTRAEQILILPLLIVPLTLARWDVPWRRRMGQVGIAILSMLVVLAPWTIYNLSRFQDPVVLSNGFGNAMGEASCDPAYHGPYTGYYDVLCLRPRTGDQSVADAADRRRALTYAANHLGRLPIVVVAREGRTFGYWNPFQQTTLDSQWLWPRNSWRHLLWMSRLGLFSYWVLLVPAVAGAIILRRRRVPVYPVLAFVVGVVLTVAVTNGESRWRAGAEVPLVLLAAAGVDAVLPLKRSDPASERDTSAPVRRVLFDAAPQETARLSASSPNGR
jgi:4-amino-4-deoxy-L-arabinose transferase-like glycosyltransferase